MIIRKALPADAKALSMLAAQMWRHAPEELEGEFLSLTQDAEAACFLAEADGQPCGFAQCQLRHDYVEGCESSPVGFLEGVFVTEDHRRTGLGRKLLAACEDWARTMGCTEFASDCELDNHDSIAWHLSAGFAEMGRTIWFAKKL